MDCGGGTLGDVRARVLVVLALSAAVLAGTALALWISTSGHRHEASGLVTVKVADLHPGDVLTTRYTTSVADRQHVPVFVADVPHEGMVALVGISTHLGCRVEWVHAPGYQRFEHHAQVAFEDPCGGSLFALNGDCLGGPCPRGLDRYSATSIGTELRINLNEINLGLNRQPTAVLNSEG